MRSVAEASGSRTLRQSFWPVRFKNYATFRFANYAQRAKLASCRISGPAMGTRIRASILTISALFCTVAPAPAITLSAAGICDVGTKVAFLLFFLILFVGRARSAKNS